MVGVIKRKSTEQKEQIRFVQYVRTFMPHLLIASIPNGSGTSAANRLKLVNEGLLAGMPDIMVMDISRILFLEFKRPDGKGRLSGKQDSIIRWINALGHYAAVVESDEQARKVLAKWLDS